ncbi:uncharacterized protein LOC144124786 [Amblyomma americanum]
MKLAGPLVLTCLFAVACGAAFRTHLDNDNEDDKTSEYRQWGQFPWDQPGNPPPIFPPDDFLMPRTGRWRSLKRTSDDPSGPWRDILKEYQGDNSDEYRIWGKFPWERPQNPPPFVPPSDTMAFSQIGRQWNQDYLAGKPERPARYSGQDDDDEHTAEEPLATFMDRKLTRVARSLWPGKPWQKPWNPPPFLPDPYPEHD